MPRNKQQAAIAISIKNANKKRKGYNKRDVTKSEYGKYIEVSRFNPITGKGVYKEKEVEYKSPGSPKRVYKQKEVVKRDKDLNWKSYDITKVLKEKGKKAKKYREFETYKNGGTKTSVKKAIRKTKKK